MAEPIVEVLVRRARSQDGNRVTSSSTIHTGIANRWTRRVTLGVLIATLGMAAALRLPRLSQSSISTEEAITFQRASLSLPRCIATATAKGQPPTYCVVMHALLRFGDSEAKLRAASAMFGVLSVAAAMLLGWLALGARGAIASGLLVAISPLAVRTSREALVFPWLCLAASIALAGVVFLARNPERACLPFARSITNSSLSVPWRAWLAYVLGTLAALYLDSGAVILFATCVVSSAVIVFGAAERRRELAMTWAIAHLSIALLWLPSFIKVLRAGRPLLAAGRANGGVLAIASGLSRLYLFAVLHNAWIAMLLAALFITGCIALRRRDPALLSLLATLSLVPPVIALIAGARAPLTLARLLMWAPLPFYAIVAAGVFSVRSRLVSAVFLAAIFGGGLWSARHALAKQSDDATPWRDIAKQLSDAYDNDTLVFATHASERAALNYYYRRRTDPILRVPITRATTLTSVQHYLREANVAWIVDTSNGTRPKAAKLRALMEQNGTLAEEFQIKNVNLVRFDLANGEPPAQGSGPAEVFAPVDGHEESDDAFHEDEQD